MKVDTKKTGTKTATAALQQINAEIEALHQKRIGLAEPLKSRYAELRTELADMEAEIRGLDPVWKPEPMKAKAETKIADILTAHGAPMAADEIVAGVGGEFSPWKVKNVLKKRSTGPKAVFTFADGKYTVKATA